MGRLSVIIPCLNEGAVIGGLLSSLQPLRARGHRVILVDGGSRDDTITVAAPWVDRVVESAPGRALQMNLGATQADGDLLWFLHADSSIPQEPDLLMAEGLARSGRVWGRFDVSLAGGHPLLRVVAWMMNLRSRLTGIATGDQGIFVRRIVFEQLGGYAAIPLMEDVELSRRLKRLSRPLCLRSRLTTSARRWERQGVLRTILLMWRLRLAYALGVSPARLADRYRMCSSPARNS